MSCSTAYLVRDVDGLWRAWWEKYGTWRLDDARERDEVLAAARKHGSPLTPAWDGWLSAWLCRGVLLDMVERRLRFYGCYGEGSSRRLENIERRVARAPVWAGWDVAYAWGGRDDFAELGPDPKLIEPEPFEQPALDQLDTAVLEWDEGFVSWEREHLRLRYQWAYWSSYGALLSVIDERLEVLDYGFTYSFNGVALLPWLLHGERLLDALTSIVPHALPHESQCDTGVIIDCPARCIRYWSGTAVPPALLADVRAAWPGWTVERLRYGLAGHLAATGRRDPEALIPDAELATEDIDPEWLRERAALVPDARGLRCIEELIVHD